MIYIVLPAYNEANSIAALFDALILSMKENKLEYKLVVVNDGSTDNTLSVINKYNRHLKIEVINHVKNKGLAETIKTGLIAALNSSHKNDIIILMDADNTHTPGLILKMIRMIREGNDVVIASRYQKGSRIRGVPFYRQLLSFLGSLLFRVLFPIKGVRDYTCGYRAYKADVLKKAFKYYGKDFINQPGFSAMVDILIKLRHFDIIINEAPLILRYDLKRDGSKMRILETINETFQLIIKRKLRIQ